MLAKYTTMKSISLSLKKINMFRSQYNYSLLLKSFNDLSGWYLTQSNHKYVDM